MKRSKSYKKGNLVPLICLIGMVLLIGFGLYSLRMKKDSASIKDSFVQSNIPTISAQPNAIDEPKAWKVWKPEANAFTFKLPSEWSVVSIDAHSSSEIRIYSTHVTWEQAHEPNRIGDLTLRIAVVTEKPTLDNKLVWSTEGDIKKSNRLILNRKQSQVSFTAEYPIESPFEEMIQEIMNTFNFEPTPTELSQADTFH
ncbi:MAG: hypothetical protein HYW33_03955 [Candidatus Blackburnbacteria bacterium]|nr:hypothetical protein [Candidatus Blackburnbacteria bacterium]